MSGFNQAAANAVKRHMDKVTGVMPTLILIALWCVVEMVPMVKFSSMVALVAMTGGFGGNPVAAFNHIRYFWSCLFAMSEVLLRAQLRVIKESPYYAIMMDSSTDIAGDDHVLIYIQYLLPNFAVATEYLCTIKVPNKTAASVYRGLMAVIETLGLSPQKLVAFASDGGSEYMGSQNGVGAQLKLLVCYLIHTHCVAHRAALAMADQVAHEIGDVLFGLSDIESVLRDVHALFGHSSKRQAEWRRFCTYTCPGVVTRFKFPMFNATRWMSRFDCVVVLTDDLPVLIKYLEKRGGDWAKGQAMLDRLRNPDLVAALMAARDILAHVQAFNAKMQKDGLLIHTVRQEVDALCDVLGSLVTGTGDARSYNSDEMRHSHNFFASYRKGKWTYKGGKRVGLADPDVKINMAAWYAFVQGLSQGIISSVRDRFPDGRLSKPWRIFDVSEYVGLPRGVLGRHFNGEFISLVGHFNNAKSPQKLWPELATTEGAAKLLEEFQAYKEIMWAQVKRFPFLSTQEAWAMIAKQHMPTLPHIIALAAIMFVIPVQTATVERGFSLHRVFKHRLTNRMRLITLDSLMRVKMLAPELCEFDLEAALAVVTECGGMRSGSHPLTIGQLFKAVCDLELPYTMADGVDLEGDEDALNWPSDDDSSDSDFEPAESDGEESSDDSMSVADSEGEVQAAVAAEMDSMRQMQEAMGLSTE